MENDRRMDQDALFSMDEDANDNDVASRSRKKKKDVKVPFTPEVS